MYTPIDLSIEFVSASSNFTSNSSIQTGDVLSWAIMICAGLLCLLAVAVFIRKKRLAYNNIPLITSKTKYANHVKTSFLKPSNKKKIFSSKFFIGIIISLLAVLIISGAQIINKAFADAQGGGSCYRHQQNYSYNRG